MSERRGTGGARPPTRWYNSARGPRRRLSARPSSLRRGSVCMESLRYDRLIGRPVPSLPAERG